MAHRTPTPLSKEALAQVKAHFIACHPNEGVGYFKGDTFYPVENVTTLDPRRSFACPLEVMLEDPDLICHSHTTGWEVCSPDIDPRAPSKEDLDGQIATAVEWALFVTDGETCDDPIYWGNPDNRPPLIGREFIFNAQDCLSLAQDYYYSTHDIRLPNLGRNHFWSQEGEDHIGQNYEAWGFYDVTAEDLLPGDALLYKVRSPVPNHIGIYLGGNQVLSHWYGRISQVEDYGKWAGHISHYLRNRKVETGE